MSTSTPPEPAKKSKKDWREIRENASTASVSLEMGLAVAAGWYLGHLFDGYFETAPWGQIFFLVAGFGAAGKAIWRTIKHTKAVMSRPEPGQIEGARR